VQRGDEIDGEAHEAQQGQCRAHDPRIGAGGWREDLVGQRRQRRQARLGRPVEEAAIDGDGPRDVEPEGEQVQAWERDAAGANLKRREVADQPHGQREGEQDHCGDPERGLDPVEDLGMDRRVLGNDQLHPDQGQLDGRNGEEAEGGADVQQANRLVVGAGRPLHPARLAGRDALGDDLGARRGEDGRGAHGSSPGISFWETLS
jgi:hypothetical protein